MSFLFTNENDTNKTANSICKTFDTLKHKYLQILSMQKQNVINKNSDEEDHLQLNASKSDKEGRETQKESPKFSPINEGNLSKENTSLNYHTNNFGDSLVFLEQSTLVQDATPTKNVQNLTKVISTIKKVTQVFRNLSPSDPPLSSPAELPNGQSPKRNLVTLSQLINSPLKLKNYAANPSTPTNQPMETDKLAIHSTVRPNSQYKRSATMPKADYLINSNSSPSKALHASPLDMRIKSFIENKLEKDNARIQQLKAKEQQRAQRIENALQHKKQVKLMCRQLQLYFLLLDGRRL